MPKPTAPAPGCAVVVTGFAAATSLLTLTVSTWVLRKKVRR